MKTCGIGALIGRVLAVAAFTWYLPATASTGVNWWNANQTNRALITPYFAALVAVLAVAVAVIFGAGRLAGKLIGDDDDGIKVNLDCAQVAAASLAFVGALALVYSAAGLSSLLFNWFQPEDKKAEFFQLLAGGQGEVLRAILGLVLLLTAPRLGIWLENTGANGGER